VTLTHGPRLRTERVDDYLQMSQLGLERPTQIQNFHQIVHYLIRMYWIYLRLIRKTERKQNVSSRTWKYLDLDQFIAISPRALGPKLKTLPIEYLHPTFQKGLQHVN
jgi:hypothetical protein